MVTLITDRTPQDAAEAMGILRSMREGTATPEQIQTFLAGMKGCWGVVDINRIQDAVDEIVEFLRGKDIQTNIQRVPTVGAVPVTFDMVEKIVGNISALVSTYYVLSTTPPIPDMTGQMTTDKANRLEQILFDLNYLREGEILGYLRSGTGYAGEETFL